MSPKALNILCTFTMSADIFSRVP